MDLYELLATIPLAVWTAILGVVGTLVVSWITNAHHTKRLKIQLRHDSNEKNAERKQALRRDIYLRAAEVIPKSTRFLISIEEFDLTRPNFTEGMDEFNLVCAKLQFVSDAKTVALVRQLQKIYFQLFALSMKKVPIINDMKKEVDMLSADLKSVQSRFVESADELEVHESMEQEDQEYIRLLKLQSRTLHSEMASLEAKLDQATASYIEALKAYYLEAMNDMRMVGDPITKLQVAMRKELGLDGDLAEFQLAMEQQWTDVIEMVQAFLMPQEAQ